MNPTSVSYSILAQTPSGIQPFLEYLEALARKNDGLHAGLVVRVSSLDKLIVFGKIKQAVTVIQELGQRLAANLRNRDFVFAIGDRELGILLPNLADEAMLLLASNKILKVIRTFDAWSDIGFKVGVHIGACFFHSYVDSEILFQRAYVAMLEAERRNELLVVFTEEHCQTTSRAVEVEEELNKAAEDFAFELYYQPQLTLASNVLTSAEVLIRWTNPRLGYVPPNLFIPIAERMGLINQITEWIIHRALNFQSQLLAIAPEFGLSINISPLNFKDIDFPQFVEEALGLWNLTPELLTLELTEGAMLENPAEALKQLETLKRLGVKLSVDDFGTGYSSLQYLSRLPIDEVKIDQAFVRDMQTCRHNLAIVNTIVSLARNFNLKTVAEGVEDAESIDYLTKIGCNKAQGYYISRPLPQSEFMQFIVATR